ncbi:MAG TPA: hypothetical protein VHW09_25580 [Bryobacteraceae bacterium]|jgi:hypothetical protein|nr:hypothetical protein [Bryobacteraceae bacterium]
MADLNHEHLTKLTAVKAGLSSLSSTPVPAGDLTNLGKKIDALAGEVKTYITAEEAIKKDAAAVTLLEEKLKEATAKLAPRISALNTQRAKIASDADAGYKIATPLAQALGKLPAYSKANGAIKDCMLELQGTKGTYSVKLKSDGKFDL